MKTIIFFLSILINFYQVSAQQNNWSDVEKILGRSGTEQTRVFKVTFPRTDLKVKVEDFSINTNIKHKY